MPLQRSLCLIAAGLLVTAPQAQAREVEPAGNLGALAERIAEEDAAARGDGEVLVDAILAPETGGLPQMRERGYLRMAVPPDPLMIAFDGENAVGVAMEIAREFELYLASLEDASNTPTVVVPTPMPRAEILPAVLGGRSDFTTLTATRAEETDGLAYTRPLIEDVNDVPVLAPGLDGVESVDNLVGLPLYVAEGSRYAANLERLNAAREAEGRPALDVRLVDGRLDDYDLIELVEIGVIPATVVTDFKARFWSSAYPSVVIHEAVELTEDGRIAWAMRQANPELRRALEGFAEVAREGTLLGNVVLERYANSADWIENLGTDAAQLRIDEVEPVIEKYSEQYDFDPDLVLAQAYQESRLDQDARSHVGAVGVMQVMPTTAADPVVGIPDVSSLDANVHAGLRYLRWLRDSFFDAPEIAPLDQTLLAFAAYNAGPGGVAKARRRAEAMGLDPDVWFENVEIAIQEAVSREPAIYVRNIFKYYVSYRLLADLEAEAAGLRERIEEIAEERRAAPARP
ncbi:transglycosylase SLT domain-containing protein [Limimaricola pyoseonensis]|uniref:Membrane-bound lytic murein transglycosylase MltF n=1 Tax=Limimaricola pyoseonensis TaxID=521013 RepID=A0A1G7KQE0_9RHOB|nr:transglycosylase SLT domain-containing protein [Limimaricola pyoseonensis]SDF39170.1 Membrane-bound lytic murein transglycosylase MltF [Limimaricola pyoseonensis]